MLGRIRDIETVFLGIVILLVLGVDPAFSALNGRYVSRANEVALDVAETLDGQYLVLGKGENDLFLMKYDQRIRRLWMRPKSFGQKSVKSAMVTAVGDQCAVIATIDDEILLLVYGLEDGRLKRQEVLDFGGRVAIQDVITYTDDSLLVGGILTVGGTLSGIQETDLVLMVVNLMGDIVQTRDYERNGDETLSQIRKTQDGGYVIVGNLIRKQLADLLVMKVSEADLTQEWVQRFDARIPKAELILRGLNAGQSITQAMDGSYLIAGTASYFSGQYQAICLKLDTEGNMVWRTPFNGLNQSSIVSRFISIYEDNHILLVAEKRLEEKDTRICFARLNTNGEQLDMVEQVKVGESGDLAAATETWDHGLLYVKNSFVERNERLVVEIQKIENLTDFFATEKSKSERALRLIGLNSSQSK